MRKRLVILGAGGFAREVRWLVGEINRARREPEFEFIGFVVRDRALIGPHDSVDSIVGDEVWLTEHIPEVDVAVLGIGDPALRLKLGTSLRSRFPALEFPALVHPSVLYDAASCSFGAGALLCAGVIATVNVRVGVDAEINLGVTLGHESEVGAGSVLNPSVNISGGVKIGSGVMLGTGAQVLQYVTIADGATVGAGAVVTKDVEAGTTVVGIPARPLGR